ncbi:hypothetical protein JTB14_007666 [Gonioctena quinquepunctata]|nr:hypothetical protein JTB14_007666 [Gonioctena quinquepunctata]
MQSSFLIETSPIWKRTLPDLPFPNTVKTKAMIPVKLQDIPLDEIKEIQKESSHIKSPGTLVCLDNPPYIIIMLSMCASVEVKTKRFLWKEHPVRIESSSPGNI